MSAASPIIDRIRKLLELAKSTNEHEAASAAARAADLMRKHEIDQAVLAATAPGETPPEEIAGREYGKHSGPGSTPSERDTFSRDLRTAALRYARAYYAEARELGLIPEYERKAVR